MRQLDHFEKNTRCRYSWLEEFTGSIRFSAWRVHVNSMGDGHFEIGWAVLDQLKRDLYDITGLPR